MDMENVEQALNLSEKVLLYIASNEPISDLTPLLTKSNENPDKVLLTLDRLYNAGLLEGHFLKGMGNLRNLHVFDLKLSHKGMKELEEIIAKKELIKGVKIKLGILEIEI